MRTAEARSAPFELLCADLRRRAHAELANHSGNTLSTTARVHEVDPKLFDKGLMILNELTQYDVTLAELTELHVVAGLEFAEIAQLLSSSERSVYRDWRMARVFLRKAMAAESE